MNGNWHPFYEGFFLLLIWLPITICWVFGLYDILFRRDDMGGWLKALWVLVLIVVPVIGLVVYVVFRPRTASREEEKAAAAERVAADEDYFEQRLAQLADLHDRGKLSDAEYAQSKVRLLGA